MRPLAGERPIVVGYSDRSTYDIVRTDLQSLIEGRPRWRVIAVADREHAMEQAIKSKADVVVLGGVTQAEGPILKRARALRNPQHDCARRAGLLCSPVACVHETSGVQPLVAGENTRGYAPALCQRRGAASGILHRTRSTRRSSAR